MKSVVMFIKGLNFIFVDFIDVLTPANHSQTDVFIKVFKELDENSYDLFIIKCDVNIIY